MARRQALSGQVTDFDLRLLRVFRAVAECGGFAAAEGELGIGRSAISLHMGDLERRLGLRLCRRGRGGFSLTDEGREILEATETLMASLEAFRTEVNALHDTLRGEFHIGITDNLVSLPEMRITHALAALKVRGPEVRLCMHMEPPGEVARAVLDGRLHLGVVPDVDLSSSLERHPLYAETSRLYCSHAHPLFATTAPTPPDDLASRDAVLPGYPLPEAGCRQQARLSATATASDREGVAFLILTGAFLGFLPDHQAAPWVAAGRLRALWPDDCVYLTPFVTIVRRDRRPNRVLEAFMEALERDSGAG